MCGAHGVVGSVGIGSVGCVGGCVGDGGGCEVCEWVWGCGMWGAWVLWAGYERELPHAHPTTPCSAQLLVLVAAASLVVGTMAHCRYSLQQHSMT